MVQGRLAGLLHFNLDGDGVRCGHLLTAMTFPKEKGKRDGYCIHGNPLDFDCGGCKQDSSSTPKTREEKIKQGAHKFATEYEGVMEELAEEESSGATFEQHHEEKIEIALRERFPEIYQRIHAPVMHALEVYISSLILKAREEGHAEGYADGKGTWERVLDGPWVAEARKDAVRQDRERILAALPKRNQEENSENPHEDLYCYAQGFNSALAVIRAAIEQKDV